MNCSIARRLALTVALIGVVWGCDSVISHIVDEASKGGTSTGGTSAATMSVDGGFHSLESDFSDAPVSPGGTGGVVGDDGAPVGKETRSFFTAYQIDPEAEDSAGPKFVVAADVDQDGLLDLVSGWTQSQPVQLHLQRRDEDDNVSFLTVTLGGTTPIGVVAGVDVGYINGDNWLDVVVLSKATGFAAFCPTSPPSQVSLLDGEIIFLFSPADPTLVRDGDRWTEMDDDRTLINPFVSILSDTVPPFRMQWSAHFPGNEEVDLEEIKVKPEWGGFTSLIVGDMNNDGYDDVIAALNPAECEELGQKPPINTVDLWLNPGGTLSEISSAWGVSVPGFSRGAPVAIFMPYTPQVKDLAVLDVDRDGDLDVIATYTDAISRNICWSRNPFIPHTPGGPGGTAQMVAGTSYTLCVGGANEDAMCSDDADCLGIPDGTCVANVCAGGENDGGTCENDEDCAGIPDGGCITAGWRLQGEGWEGHPIAQLDPVADVMALGDIDGDGHDDVVVRAAETQIVQWFRQPWEPSTATASEPIEPAFPPPNPLPDRVYFPWDVFTLTELVDQEPEAIAVGDITGDGCPELMVAAEGAVYWYDGTTAASVYDPWLPNTIIQDAPADTSDQAASGGGGATPGAGVGVGEVDTSTHINTLLVVDLDGDGRNDLVGTLDRRSGAGLSDDRLVWYRNTRTEQEP